MVRELIDEVARVSENINNTEKLTVTAKETVDEGIKTVEYQKGKMLVMKSSHSQRNHSKLERASS